MEEAQLCMVAAHWHWQQVFVVDDNLSSKHNELFVTDSGCITVQLSWWFLSIFVWKGQSEYNTPFICLAPLGRRLLCCYDQMPCREIKNHSTATWVRFIY